MVFCFFFQGIVFTTTWGEVHQHVQCMEDNNSHTTCSLAPESICHCHNWDIKVFPRGSEVIWNFSSSSKANSRILMFLGSNLRISPCSLCSRPWILQVLLNTSPASISMPRKMSLACRERSESWWITLVSVWQLTSSNAENNTGLRSLRLPLSSAGLQPSFAESRLTRRGSMLLWWKGIFYFIAKRKTIITPTGAAKHFAQKTPHSFRASPGRVAFICVAK